MDILVYLLHNDRGQVRRSPRQGNRQRAESRGSWWFRCVVVVEGMLVMLSLSQAAVVEQANATCRSKHTMGCAFIDRHVIYCFSMWTVLNLLTILLWGFLIVGEKRKDRWDSSTHSHSACLSVEPWLWYIINYRRMILHISVYSHAYGNWAKFWASQLLQYVS